MALTDKLTAIGDAIRAKTGGTDLLTLDEMPDEIASIEGGGGDLPPEALIVTGNCNYRFSGANAWNWYIENYGSQVTTNNITYTQYMFSNKTLNIPFTLNMGASGNVEYLFSGYKGQSTPEVNMSAMSSTSSLNEMFYNASNIKRIGSVIAPQNFTPSSMRNIFYQNYNLEEIPDFIVNADFSSINSKSSEYYGPKFTRMYSLRSIPKTLCHKCYSVADYNYYSPYREMFSNCCSLSAIEEIFPVDINYTSNFFSNFVEFATRVNKVTFKLDDNNLPYVRSWKSQTLNLAQGTNSSGIQYGIGVASSDISSYGNLIEKEVTDATSYEALKNDPDWWTRDYHYCRYNHDSAVETINSLPDTSAYLETAGGTNTIKFARLMGDLTDGGAINTLTEEEIAVATAKGWTVTFA